MNPAERSRRPSWPSWKPAYRNQLARQMSEAGRHDQRKRRHGPLLAEPPGQPRTVVSAALNWRTAAGDLVAVPTSLTLGPAISTAWPAHRTVLRAGAGGRAMTGTCTGCGLYQSGDPSGKCWECRMAEPGYRARLDATVRDGMTAEYRRSSRVAPGSGRESGDPGPYRFF